MSRWVCLMYHDITPRPEPSARGNQYYGVSAAGFARQLDVLVALGRAGRSMEELAAAPPHAVPAVGITFDDGNTGQLERGVPALLDRGMRATFFVTTNWVGTPGYISWAGLRDMQAAGMSIQSHTRSHPFLSQLGEAALREELYGSRQELNQQLGQDTLSIALPGGDPPRASLRAAIAAAGYRLVGTSRWGTNALPAGGLAWINRCTIRGELDADAFGRIAAGDRWLSAQRHLREAGLRWLRTALGPRRYALLRRRFLDAIIGTPPA